MSRAYYNEIEPFKAEVLREAIKAEPSRREKWMSDQFEMFDPRILRGFTQCHFFAGGGFWSLALRQAGWPDDRPAWTASSPCPSFSAAGKGQGFSDPRHLWPEVERLTRVLALQSSLESRLLQRLDTAGSTLFKLTWRRSITPLGRRLLERAVSVRRTSGSGCTSWPTPRATGSDGNAGTGVRRGERPGRTVQSTGN